MLDIFRDSAYRCVELTDAINRIPATPTRIEKMGIFSTKGVKSVDVAIEEKDKVISLIPTSARGTPGVIHTPEKRTLRTLRCPHLQKLATVMADDVQGVRAFGSENEKQTVAQLVDEKIAGMRRDHDLTLEYHRLGAIQGIVLDANGTTVVHNLWEEFECTPDVIEFDFTAATPSIKDSCKAVKRAMEANLGAQLYDHIHCFCNSTFFDLLVNEAGVVAAYALWNHGALARSDMRAGFEYCGIVFEEYTGSVGTTAFIPTVAAGAPGNAFFFPVGVPDLFKTYFAPADYVEAANTLGIQYYAKTAVMKFDKGIEIETQSNPLCVCTRPMAVIRGQYV